MKPKFSTLLAQSRKHLQHATRHLAARMKTDLWALGVLSNRGEAITQSDAVWLAARRRLAKTPLRTANFR